MAQSMLQLTTPQLLAQVLAPAAPSATTPLGPGVILALCVVAGVGTVLLLPSRREASLRKIGGVILLAAGLIAAALLVRGAAAGAGMGVYFWIFSSIALIGAVRVVTHTKPVYSALYFVLTVFATAGLFLLMWADFMAAALILIYAGAILITYVFVIMLAAEATGSSASQHGSGGGSLAGFAEADRVSRDPVIAAAVGFALMGVILMVIFDKYQALPQPKPVVQASSITAGAGVTERLGEYLFTYQSVNLELAGLILTLAMVGAIMIARRQVYHEDAAGVELEERREVVLGPSTPINDNPHSIPVYGTTNPRQKAYPET